MPDLINTVAVLTGGMLGIFVLYSFISSFLPPQTHSGLNHLANAALFALAGIYTILFPIEIMEGVIGDTRGAVLVAATLFGGWLSGVTAALAMVVLRLVTGGPGALAGVIGIALELLVLLIITQPAWRERLPPRSLGALVLAALMVSVLEAGSLLLIPPLELGVQLFLDNGLALALLQLVAALTLGLLLKFQHDRDGLLGSLQEKHRELDYQANHDALTGLANRRKLLHSLTKAINCPGDAKPLLGLLYLDLDQFRRVNDALGHALGDRLLQAVGKRIDDIVRQSLGERGLAVRLGGDEFVVLVNPLNSADEAIRLADALLEVLGEPVRIKPHDFRVSASIGISLFPAHGDNPDTLMQNADAAMYCAKDRGRNTRVIYTSMMTTEAHDRMMLAEDLRKALEEGRLTQFYQPIVDLRSGRLAGLEALARWHHPRLGMVSPEVFIGVAEESGLIAQLGDWALATACHQARVWIDAGRAFGRISVNVSGLELARGDLVERVERALAHAQLAPRYLDLEITETAVMDENDETRDLLEVLRTREISISIDDFGTGYSSLARLRSLPADKLKLDRGFVHGLPANAHDVAMVRCITAMGDIMGFTVLAEGVENQAQRDFLLRNGCHQAQGYWFGKPMPATEVSVLLDQHARTRLTTSTSP